MRVNRRRFLQKSTGIISASAAASIVPYHFTSSLFAADEKIKHKIGCIGVGEEGKYIMPGAMKCGEVVAVCDVDKKHLEAANQLAGGKAAMYEDYQRILDDKSINAVVIATPDHWHTKISVEAMRAGKHVYCEKPLTLTIDEGKLISKVQKETKKVFQVGTQQRSEMDAIDDKKVKHQMQFLKAVGIVQSGRLGKIKRIHCFIGGAPTCNPLPKVDVPAVLNWEKWQGQAPLADYVWQKTGSGPGYSRCHYEFRWWYEYSGGKMTDWGAHHVDIASWMLDAGNTGPVKVEPVMAEFPCKMKKGMPVETDRYNTATKFEIKCTYTSGAEIIIRHEPSEELMKSAKIDDNGLYVEGEKGNLFISRNRFWGPTAVELKENPIPEELIMKLYKGKKPNGNHMDNFFNCIHDGGEPVSDVHSHHRAMTTCHLANIAIRLDRPLKWDPVKEEIVGDNEAFAMQSRSQRKGYEVTA
jgi:predicted dehydrogenase